MKYKGWRIIPATNVDNIHKINSFLSNFNVLSTNVLLTFTKTIQSIPCNIDATHKVQHTTNKYSVLIFNQVNIY